MTKVGVIIPDRGDRPEFLLNCWRLLQRQTLQPHRIELVNDKPFSEKVDITWRYRKGYNRFCQEYRNGGNPHDKEFESVDVIAFMENDDWYSSDYLETMVKAWESAKRPDLLGTNYTIYYHLGLRAYFTMKHVERSSAMSTLIKPDLSFQWPVDHEPFTDMWIWTRTKLTKKTFDPGRHICLGIKHGVGKFGGGSHTERLDRYDPPRGTHDHYGDFLKSVVDVESFEFYQKFKKINTAHIANNTDFLPSAVDL
jgi:hypothetical protein